jgi:hypothetical protein
LHHNNSGSSPQVVGELRSQYAVGVKMAAQRLAAAAFASPATAPGAILDQLWGAISPAPGSRQPHWQRSSQPADPKLNSQLHVSAAGRGHGSSY